MTFSQNLEQVFTSRPNSLVRGYTLRSMFCLPALPQSQMGTWNWAMHYGEGALAGGICGVMTLYGVSGFFANFMFAGLRLLLDQTAENATGVGAQTWSWPWQEQVVDVLHKGVFAFVTGFLADLWV